MSFASDITPILIKHENGARIFEAQITPNWLIVVGPNGGFIAALILRAMNIAQNQDQDQDQIRLPRSLTIDYLASPQLAPVEIETKIIRQGRSLTSRIAYMKQDDKLIAQASASFSLSHQETLSLASKSMPEVAPPDQCDPMPAMLPIHGNYQMRPAFGAFPFTNGAVPVSGGWTALNEPPEQLWPETLAAISDAWPPALFSIMKQEDFQSSRGMPTIELSIYFIAPQNYAAINGHDPVLARFETREAYEGFFTEDGDIWSQQGQLLARARQIAIVR